jgi:hypothetical protein
MRRILLLVMLCLLAVATTGCKKARLRAQLKELMGSTIVLPEKISCVYNGEVFPMPDSLRDRPKLIVYIDSTECTTCRISRIEMYRPLYNIANETQRFSLLLLLANKDLSGIPLIQYLRDMEIDMILYVDNDNRFSELNSVMCSDSRLHSVLVDETGKPQVVGDPSRSDRIMSLFSKRINYE